MKTHFIQILFILVCATASAQDVALKTNLLYGGVLWTPNLGAEVGISPKTSIDLFVAYNPFKQEQQKFWKHLLVQPGVRFWPCERGVGSFWGVHAHWAVMNFAGLDLPFDLWPSLKDYRYQGQMVGVGASYGYAWPLARHWSLEAEIGLGYGYLWYKKYPCEKCGEQLGKGHKNYVGPTKGAINLIYQF